MRIQKPGGNALVRFDLMESIHFRKRNGWHRPAAEMDAFRSRPSLRALRDHLYLLKMKKSKKGLQHLLL